MDRNDKIQALISDALDTYMGNSSRSKQSADGILGPSDIGFCRNKAALMTKGVAATDNPPKWAAAVGTAIHNYVEAAIKEAADRIAALEAENERLRKLTTPQWFYPAGEYESDQCESSPYNVIDSLDLLPGKSVVEINAATPLPSIYCVVQVFTDDEKDARESDECYEIKEFSSESEAQAALTQQGAE